MTTGVELLESLPVAVYTTDAEGRITYFNSAAAELWGLSPKIGEDLWCGSWRLYFPDGRPMAHHECPMAVALKEGRPVRGEEAILERPDGRRIPFAPFPTPLRDSSGRITGAINLLMDVTAHRHADIEKARLAAIVESSDDAIVSKTLTGEVKTWNSGAARIFGYSAEEMIGQHISKIIPPELLQEEDVILARLSRGERIDHYETVRSAKSGRRVHVSLTVSPVRDKLGNVVGASKVARDITQRRNAEHLQRLLFEELNHRVKNTLATVQAIASQSLIHAKSPKKFVSSFSGRIQALARAHTLLTQSSWQGAEISGLIRDQVTLGSNEDPRVTYSGPSFILDAQTAVKLALVLHELGTNARKHGALSVPEGKLSASWDLRLNGACEFRLEWIETGGPKVSSPSGHGFGTTLIEQSVVSCGGRVSVEYADQGLRCRIVLPYSEPLQIESPPGLLLSTADAAMKLPGSRLEMPVAGEKRILVIEDEVLLSMDIETSLLDAGYQVIGPAGTVEAAKKLISEGQCDAALVDANLGGQPVDELAISLAREKIPFAFVTGYGRDALPQEFRQNLLLGKPFSPDQLLGVVFTLLGKRALSDARK
ncbi:MAG: PAS domain S-box protein [Hyphomicrobiales bacterium]|nr:PAS domain S-box protein [Hyphomicrobiales bacterium]MBV9519368.1 PAS domain S-box protein [Hyphomicrobiales bacterium]